MSINFIFIAVISIIFGILFFVIDFYQRELPKIHISLIAGISISYFFLVILPEIAENTPIFPFEITVFEYLFVLIGFVFVHTSEKLILQRVDSKSQRRMRKLIEKEKRVEYIEDDKGDLLSKEIKKEDLDAIALKDMAKTLADLHWKSEKYKLRIDRYKAKIQYHINEDLSNLHFSTEFTYHFLIGIIVVELLAINLIGGILFFLFAWFKAVITNRHEKQTIFTDLDIYETFHDEEKMTRKYIQALSNLLGVLVGLILDFIHFEYTGLFYIFYSFISGVILYTIVREVLPEKEKGKPLYFIIGFVGFTLVIFVINILTNFIS